MSDQYVYFIQADENGPIKIGFTADDPKRRLAQLQTGNPHCLRLLGAIGGDTARERQFHSELAAWRLQGEWFEPHATVLAAVNEALSGSVQPTNCGGLRCWFCEACQHNVSVLIRGPGDVNICNNCISNCAEIVSEQFLKIADSSLPIPPAQMGYGG